MSPKGTDNHCVRAFLAIRLPLNMAATLNKKARHRAGADILDDVRWIPPQQQHITIRFLGNSKPGQLNVLVEKLQNALTGSETFDCMTGRFEFFPNARKPRVLALKMHSGQELKRLAKLCEYIAVESGFPAETRYFRPHVTVGRFKKFCHITPSHFFNLGSYRMSVGEIVLMKSIFKPEGTEYEVMHSFPLQPLAKTA